MWMNQLSRGALRRSSAVTTRYRYLVKVVLLTAVIVIITVIAGVIWLLLLLLLPPPPPPLLLLPPPHHAAGSVPFDRMTISEMEGEWIIYQGDSGTDACPTDWLCLRSASLLFHRSGIVALWVVYSVL